MNLISSADLDWGIGYQNELLFRTRQDMQHVKELTTGNVIVMGRNTFFSLPGQKPLPNRINVVLSETDDFGRDDIVVCENIPALLAHLAQYDPASIFVFGGQSVYAQLLPYCNTAYITQYDTRRQHDAVLPRFSELPEWTLAERSAQKSEDGLQFTFDIYRRISPV